MTDAKTRFISTVLGEDGAKALRKAAERSAPLGNALLPRTILAWLNLAARVEYEGELPGCENSYINFAKHESVYDGAISIHDQVYHFEKASLLHVASAVAVALGYDHELVDPALRDADVSRLGKSIDLLAKAQLVAQNLAKTDSPGPAHAPTQPTQAQAPTAPTKQQRIPKPPEPTGHSVVAPPAPKLRLPRIRVAQPSLKVTKHEAGNLCSQCGGSQFRGTTFRGCVCFRDLAKSVKVTSSGDSLILSFGSAWDSESIAVLVDALGVNRG